MRDNGVTIIYGPNILLSQDPTDDDIEFIERFQQIVAKFKEEKAKYPRN